VRKCSIIGCRGNYRKRQDSDDENKVSIFRFPKDKESLQLWLRKIQQDNLTTDQITDYMGVCERHFDVRYIISEYSTTGPDGVKKTWPRDAPVLDPDEVLSIFPYTPSYLSPVPPPKRKAPDERRAEASSRNTAVFQLWLDEDLMSNVQFRYVLLGKLQTDYLEFRFSQYRQLSGANYNVSVCQIMESEKKLKLLSIMKIVKCENGALTLKDFITSYQKKMNSFEQDESDIDNCLQPFMSILTECDSLIIAENEMSGIIFISGYIGFILKAKLACIDCRIVILTERATERALDCDYPCDESFEYLSKVDRCRLTWPIDLLVDVVVQTITVFKCLVA